MEKLMDVMVYTGKSTDAISLKRSNTLTSVRNILTTVTTLTVALSLNQLIQGPVLWPNVNTMKTGFVLNINNFF